MNWNLRILFGVALSIFASVPAFSEQHGSSGSSRPEATSQADRCAQRVKEAGCYLSNNDVQRIRQNVQKCKHVESNSGKTHLEVFLLENSDKLIVFQTKGTDVPDSRGMCPVTKYTVDRSGIKDVKILGSKTWMVSNDGQLYVMFPDQQMFEVKNSKGKSYKGIQEIKGVNGDADSIRIIGKDFDATITGDSLNSRPKEKLQFVKTLSFESLFRDR